MSADMYIALKTMSQLEAWCMVARMIGDEELTGRFLRAMEAFKAGTDETVSIINENGKLRLTL